MEELRCSKGSLLAQVLSLEKVSRRGRCQGLVGFYIFFLFPWAVYLGVYQSGIVVKFHFVLCKGSLS